MNRPNSSAGFTLIEVLVAIAIMIVLSGILLPNYKLAGDKLALLRAAYRLAQDLRRVQEMATSARALAGTVPPGYGVYLRTGVTSYLLYADNGSQAQVYDSNDTTIETIYLESGTYIKEISTDPMSINFKGPDPITSISGGISSVSITLALEKDPTRVVRVTINKAGLVYVE